MALIEREAAKARKVYCEERHEYVVPVAELDWLLTIDAAPVVHGRLIHASCSHDRFEDCCKCSVCGTEYGVNYFGPGVNYCTCCGARMDGGGDNG